MRTPSEINKTLHWLTKIDVRLFYPRTTKRRKIDANAFGTYERAQRGLWDSPEHHLDGPGPPTWSTIWTVPGRQLGAQDSQHGTQAGQLASQNDPTWRPEAVRSASQRVPRATRSSQKRPERARMRPQAKFYRCCIDFWFAWTTFGIHFWLLW